MDLRSSCHAASEARAPRQRTQRGSPRKNAPGISRMRPGAVLRFPASAPRGMGLGSSCHAASEARAPQSPARNENSKIDSIIKPCPAQQQIYAPPPASGVLLFPAVSFSLPHPPRKEPFRRAQTANLPRNIPDRQKSGSFFARLPGPTAARTLSYRGSPCAFGSSHPRSTRIKRNIPDKRYSPVGDFPVRMIRFLRYLPLMIRKRDHRSTACALDGTANNGILSFGASPSFISILSF